MDELRIVGGRALAGDVTVSKAKNSYLKIIIATLLNPNKIILDEVPNLRDVRTIFKVIEELGVKIEKHSNNCFSFDTSKVDNFSATYELVKTMRASILVLGPLLARFKKAKVSLPGGCAIGSRPIDLHLKNLEKMGAIIDIKDGYVEATTTGLKGAKIVLDFPSVGATENIMMAAVLADGETIIENAAKEPEIEDLSNFLSEMGAEITGAGTSVIKVSGVKLEDLKETKYTAIGDRIEAATFIIAGLMTSSEIKVNGFAPGHLDSVVEKLKEMGANLEVGPDYIKTLKSELKGVNIDTAPHPGFPTDVQAQMMALMSVVKGQSIVSENIFENRFMHVPELIRMGAKIELKGKTAIIEGVNSLSPAPVMCTDLRASAALILASLIAKGESEISRIYHLDRGYDLIHEKLKNLGADVIRIDVPM